MNASRLSLLLLTACLMFAPAKASAALYANGTSFQAPLDFGAQFAGRSLALRAYSPLWGPGQRNTTATFLNSRYVLTSAHALYDDLALITPEDITGLEVADGPNASTDRGNVRTVSRFIIHPDYDRSENTPDIAILELAEPLTSASTQVIGSIGVGEIAYSSGYGSWGTPATGLVRDYWRRAFDARVYYRSFWGPDFLYQSTTFGWTNSGLFLNGQARNGDSGSPVFNQAGQLVGIQDSASTGLYELGNSNFLKLSEPSLKAWIEAQTSPREGDATRDGSVSFDDLLIVAQHYAQPGTWYWENGDFTYDRAVNFDDLLILAQHYGTNAVTLPSDMSPAFTSDWALAQAMVPEPTLWVGSVSMALMASRRRKQV